MINLFLSKNQDWFVKSHQENLGYELKVVGEPEYYSGANIEYYEDRKFCTVSAKTYIKSICGWFEKLTKTTLKNYVLPIDAGDHPEMDDTYLLPPHDISVYQMLVGSLQWAVILGHWGVQYFTNRIVRFAQNIRDGHFKQALRVFGYLKH